MLLAALIAIVTRVNLPLSVALVWITNPITIPPMFYALYRLGWILGVDAADMGVEITFDWLFANFFAISKPLVIGAFFCGLISGSVGSLQPISFGVIVSCDDGANAEENEHTAQTKTSAT